MLCGSLAYETLEANLTHCIPSISSIHLYLREHKSQIIEGNLRCKDLRKYLDDNHLPSVISLSEDATRIVNRIQYDAATNQLVGFVLPTSTNGMPIMYSYLARSAKEIENNFLDNSENMASYANVIMAQPLAEGYPAFCLLIFGSDSKYKAWSVHQRWQYIKKCLEEENIHVISFCSDSDPRYNAVMKNCSRLGENGSTFSEKDWFNCNIESDSTYVQDTEHIATKMRNALLKTDKNLSLKIGTCKITVEHLNILLQNFSKDKHNLTPTTINPIDKMNYDSVLRICDQKVMNMLSENIPDSKGTIMYLRIISNIINAFRNPNLSPEERIFNIWYACFVLRFWRNDVIDSSELLKTHFISLNAYVCVELNAHSLILILLYLRNHDLAHLFLPTLLGSQQCESIFRQLRSLSSTYSTVTNATGLEILHRLKRIDLQTEISYTALPQFNFPRIGNKLKAVANNKKHFDLPSDSEICRIIENSKEQAIHDLMELNLNPNAFESTCSKFNTHKYDDFLVRADVPSIPPLRTENFDHELNCHTLFAIDDVELRDYSMKSNINTENLPQDGPYVKVKLSCGDTIIVRKTSLCWLFTKDKCRLSTDRLQRVAAKE